MSRNDAALYSGLASPHRLKTVKAKEEVTRPEPKAEAILDLIAADKVKLASIQTALTSPDVPTAEKVAALERQADQYAYLCSLERRFINVLGK